MTEHEFKTGDRVELVLDVGAYRKGDVFTVGPWASRARVQTTASGVWFYPTQIKLVAPDIDALKNAVIDIAKDILSDTIQINTEARYCNYPKELHIWLRDRIQALDAATRKTPEQLKDAIIEEALACKGAYTNKLGLAIEAYEESLK